MSDSGGDSAEGGGPVGSGGAGQGGSAQGGAGGGGGTPAHAFWQTTFDCGAWDQTNGLGEGDLACDSLSGWGGWTTPGHPDGDQITVDANYPGGAGGKGFRHWRGDGTNNNGGGIDIAFGPLTEFWVRFYMRYPTGFGWINQHPHYTKDIYVNAGGPQSFTLGFHDDDHWGVAEVNPDSDAFFGSPGWQTLNGGFTGNDSWHCFESHVKMDTDGTDGVAESWIDGVLVHSHVDNSWGTTGGWEWMLIGSNQSSVDNGGVEMYTDFDDFALSASGQIGCL